MDPKIENMEMCSPYASNYDNPIRFMDMLGDEPQSGDCCFEWVDDLLISASGVVGGIVNTVSFGAISSDPLNFRRKLNEDQLERYDNAVLVGKTGPLFFSGRSSGRTTTPPLELAPAGPGPATPIPLTSTVAPPIVLSPIANASSTGSNSNEKAASKIGSAGEHGNNASQNQAKQSKVEKSTKTENIGNGTFTKTTEVRPGKGPGQSRAEYIKYKNKSGETIKVVKDSYDRANKFQHRKDKL